MVVDPWAGALREHQQAMRAFLAVCERVPPSRWHVAPAPGRWTPSEVTLHLCYAYELGRDAATGGSGMRLCVTPLTAWMLRSLLLPAILLTDRFPHGVRAPKEIVPDSSSSGRLSLNDALARLAKSGWQAAEELHRTAVERPAAQVMHAYCGALTPHAALRVLSAHTRHHTRALTHQVENAR